MRQVESAQLVWDALAEAGPKGLSREQLVLKTGLTRHQVVHAFAYIKDALMDHYEQPLIYDNVQNVYSLPPKWREAGDYIDYRIHGILVMVRRVELVADALGCASEHAAGILDDQRYSDRLFVGGAALAAQPV